MHNGSSSGLNYSPTSLSRHYDALVQARTKPYNHAFFVMLRSEYPTLEQQEAYWDAVFKIERRIRLESYVELTVYVGKIIRSDDPNKILSALRRSQIVKVQDTVYNGPGRDAVEWEVFGDELPDVEVPLRHQPQPIKAKTVQVVIRPRGKVAT